MSRTHLVWMSSFVCCDGNILDGTSTNRPDQPQFFHFVFDAIGSHTSRMCLASQLFQSYRLLIVSSALKYSGSDSLQMTSNHRRGHSKFRPMEIPHAETSCGVPVYSFANPAGSSHASTAATIVSERRSVRSKTLLTPLLVLGRDL